MVVLSVFTVNRIKSTTGHSANG